LLVAHADRRAQDDGRIASPGLWMLERECPAGADAATSGVTVEAPAQHVVLIASVPLSRKAWRPLSEGELLVLKDAEVVPLA
jgi:predicted glutamine amidotransferase